MPSAAGSRAHRSTSPTLGSVRDGRPSGTGPTTWTPARSTRSKSATTAVAPSIAMRGPGQDGEDAEGQDERRQVRVAEVGQDVHHLLEEGLALHGDADDLADLADDHEGGDT